MSLALMARVTCSVSSLMGLFEWNLGPSFVIGSALHCSLTRLPTDARAISEGNSGGPMASP